MSAVSAMATLDSVGSLQRVLYRIAKAQSSRKFHALADKVHRPDVLRRAWVDVATNMGAAGVDGVTIADIKELGVSELLDGLRVELAVRSMKRSLPRRECQKRVPSRVSIGEGHGRREDPEDAALKNPPA